MELAMREKAAPEEEKKETDLKTKVVTNEN